MFNKRLIALTAAVIVGSASAAFSYDDPESRIGDKYPWLDQSSRPILSRNVGGPYVPARQLAGLDQRMVEDVESRVADRYPTLEPNIPPQSAGSILRARVSMRQGQYSVLTSYADPESRIGDKYPFLDRGIPTGTRALTTARIRHARRNI